MSGEVDWLIGQALAGIQSIGAPHQIIHKFSEDLLKERGV